MRIQDVRDALLTVLPGRVYHFTAPTEAADGREPYAVWGETSLGTAYGDDAPAEWAPSGMIYYYTPEEYDPTVDRIVLALAEAGISVSPGRIGWDERTNVIAYEIGWTVDCAPGELYDE